MPWCYVAALAVANPVDAALRIDNGMTRRAAQTVPDRSSEARAKRDIAAVIEAAFNPFNASRVGAGMVAAASAVGTADATWRARGPNRNLHRPL